MYYKELSTRFILQAHVTHSFMNNKHTHSTAIADLAVEMSVKTATYDRKIHHILKEIQINVLLFHKFSIVFDNALFMLKLMNEIRVLVTMFMSTDANRLKSTKTQ